MPFVAKLGVRNGYRTIVMGVYLMFIGGYQVITKVIHSYTHKHVPSCSPKYSSFGVGRSVPSVRSAGLSRATNACELRGRVAAVV